MSFAKKSNTVDCSTCPLFNQTMIKGEFVNTKNIKDIDVLILAEAPSHDEIRENRPLIGPAGQIFRKAFSVSKLDTMKSLISNVVLCANIQGKKTVNPPEEAVEKCSPHWQKFITAGKPKAVLIMGATAMKAFGFGDSGILKKRGQWFDYNGTKVKVTLHPSYILRNGGVNSDEYKLFVQDMMDVYSSLEDKPISSTPKSMDESELTINPTDSIDKNHSFKLPSWCYSSDVCLIDIQHIMNTNQIIYIFRTKDGEKKIHSVSAKDNYFYSRNGRLQESPMLSSITDVALHMNENSNLYEKSAALYEADVNVELKHSIDYKRNRKETECNTILKTMYWDIENYLEGSRDFPDPKKALKPINAISWKINDGPTHLLLLNLKQMDKKPITYTKENVVIKHFNTEKELLLDFFASIRSENPDIFAAWNGHGYDIPCVYGRCKRNNIDTNLMSPIGQTSINPMKFGDIHIHGLHAIDLLELYKFLTYSVEESNTLEAVSQKILGKGKAKYEGTLDQLYENDIDKFIEYSVTDTELLFELSKKLGHLDLMFELVKICSTTWKAAETTTGQLDPLCISYAKNKGLVCRNAIGKKEDIAMPGAYVRTPLGGPHSYIMDLDFASLYPSIIRTCNIGPNTYIARIKDTEDNRIIFGYDKEGRPYYFNKDAHTYIYNRDNLKDIISIELNPISEHPKEYRISKKKFFEFLEHHNAIVTISGSIYKGHDKEISFFSEILEHLMNSRSEYKNMKKKAQRDNDDYLIQKYECIQMAYKILANSLYGVLASFSFRFYNIDMAKTITLTGQEVVKFSGFHLGNYMKHKSLEIDGNFLDDYDSKKIPYLVYQDTDSLFIQVGEYLINEGKLTIQEAGKN